MAAAPIVSVVMSVYNARAHVREAVESILRQTYDDFELVVIDDGSTDGSGELVSKFTDERIRLVRQSNCGLAAALNHGIMLARGRYIARMDADDVSDLDRLLRQVDLLNVRPDVAIVGTSFEVIDERGNHLETFWALPHDEDIRRQLLVRNPFGHGTVMIRKEALLAVGGYRLVAIEDYDLWIRVLREYRGANVPDVLYHWRVNPSGMSHGSAAARKIPLHDLVRSIDPEVAGRLPTYRAARRRLREYEVLDRAVAGKIGQQYVADLYAVGIHSFRRHKQFTGLLLVLRAALLRPRSLVTFVRLYVGGEGVGGYNLAAVAGPPSLVRRAGAAATRRVRSTRKTPAAE
jgi:glycosyltransferase involved in cell wall biosynthesis